MNKGLHYSMEAKVNSIPRQQVANPHGGPPTSKMVGGAAVSMWSSVERTDEVLCACAGLKL